ncbi:MAG TPA: enoyl-CoA hydratase-related protein, partial [Jatrophihabitantaceae bacterium]|nr:enoyl-CoA hydratase-related protein [Jatrophihabitantaceae bacterium]
MGEFVQVETGGEVPTGVATILLSRPPMNALNTAVQAELRAAAEQVANDPAVRAVVLYG